MCSGRRAGPGIAVVDRDGGWSGMTTNISDIGVRPQRRPSKAFKPFHQADRGFFLVYVALIWAAILAGFGPEIAHHVAKKGFSYPLIVHFHAAAFVGWLVLFAIQVGLVRIGRTDLHRKLGVAGAGLAAAMLVLGPMVALITDGLEFGTPSSDPPFLITQLSDIAAFGALIGSALLLRNDGPAHKRLVLIATCYLSDAGFATRWAMQSALASSAMPASPIRPEGSGCTFLLILGIGPTNQLAGWRLHQPLKVVGSSASCPRSSLIVVDRTLPGGSSQVPIPMIGKATRQEPLAAARPGLRFLLGGNGHAVRRSDGSHDLLPGPPHGYWQCGGPPSAGRRGHRTGEPTGRGAGIRW